MSPTRTVGKKEKKNGNLALFLPFLLQAVDSVVSIFIYISKLWVLNNFFFHNLTDIYKQCAIMNSFIPANWISMSYVQLVSRIYKDELELETYIRSDLYGTCSQVK